MPPVEKLKRPFASHQQVGPSILPTSFLPSIVSHTLPPILSNPQQMSKTRAEIEAEIARLTARLDHVGFDPAFTPTELVRWDPSLVGTVLHLQHQEDIPANSFDTVYAKGRQEHCLDSAVGSYCNGAVPSKKRMTMESALTPVGLRYIKSAGHRGAEKGYKFDVSNDFESMTQLPISVGRWFERDPDPTRANLSCKALGMTVELSEAGFVIGFILPLANPERPLLDQIFVATTSRINDVDIVVDKYPLSTLYQEWRRDKEAARGAPPLRRTELAKAKAQIAELQAQMRVLMADSATDRAKEADLAKQNERLRAALHVAVQTPNPREVVPEANATAATAKAASSNATSLTNATAAADPV
jgi:hypothetical protein